MNIVEESNVQREVAILLSLIDIMTQPNVGSGETRVSDSQTSRDMDNIDPQKEKGG